MLYEYDATNEQCPVPLVNLRLLLNKMNAGDHCIIRLSDQGSKQDIPALLHKKGFCFQQKNITKDIIELTITMRK